MGFADLDESEKLLQHEKLLECAHSYGGVNAFLQLIEALRATKPHPLINKECVFYFALGSIRWNKVIFKDKLTLLISARQNESKNNNLIPAEGEKNHKTTLNLVRTLKPVEFIVKPKNIKDGDGFVLYPFDVISDSVTRLNPLFDALFFNSVDSVKKVLNFKPRDA